MFRFLGLLAPKDFFVFVLNRLKWKKRVARIKFDCYVVILNGRTVELVRSFIFCLTSIVQLKFYVRYMHETSSDMSIATLERIQLKMNKSYFKIISQLFFTRLFPLI
jgi:hypothetical protein